MQNTRSIVGLIVLLGILLPAFAISRGNGEEAVPKTVWDHVGDFTSKVFTDLPKKWGWWASLFFGLALTLLLAYFVNKKSKKVEREDGTEVTITFINSLLQIRSDKGRRICNIISFVVAFVVLSLVAGAVTVGVTDKGETKAREGRAVPAVVDLPKDEAFKELVASGFKKEEVDEKAEDSHTKKGIVVRQDPTEGATLDVGNKITLYISTGKASERDKVQPVPLGTEVRAPAKVSVPNVVGKKYEAAKAIIGRSGLGITLGNRVQRNDNEPGEVTRQKPKPNVSVDRGTTVTVDVCVGPKTCDNKDCMPVLLKPGLACEKCGREYKWWSPP